MWPVPVGFVLGAVAAAVLWRATRPVFGAEVFARENFRGRRVPVGVGVLLPVVTIAVEAVFVVMAAAGVEDAAVWSRARLVVLAAVIGFGLLGLLDDLAGTAEDKGFAGHLRAMRRGRLTTGGLKLLGGGALALVVAGAAPAGSGLGRLVVDALLIALSANLGNLFDRAPGRVAKVALVAYAGVLLGAGFDGELTGVAVIAGAAAVLLWPDLRERLMLGDAGSNVLGAVAGLGVVLSTAFWVRVVVLVVVLVLNLASEAVSFSKVIDRVAPLRYADRLGRGD